MTTGEYILIAVLTLLMITDLVGNTLVCVVVLRNRYEFTKSDIKYSYSMLFNVVFILKDFNLIIFCANSLISLPGCICKRSLLRHDFSDRQTDRQKSFKLILIKLLKSFRMFYYTSTGRKGKYSDPHTIENGPTNVGYSYVFCLLMRV
jgi:hypothetical protein